MSTSKIKEQMEQLETTTRQAIKQMGAAEAARITGIHRTTISAWVYGRRKWSYEMLIRVAEKLEVRG